MNKWDMYGKSMVAFSWAVVSVVIPLVSGDGRVDTVESLIIVTAIGNNLIVFLVPVFPQFKSAKTVITAVLAGVAVLATMVPNGGFGGLDANDWYQVAAAIGVTLGLWYAPAATETSSARVTSGLNS